MITIQGKSVFGGVSIGKLMFYKRNEKVIKREHISDADAEWKRFEAAKGQAVDQLKELYEKALEDVGEANAMIFEIHQMMLEDLDYLESIENIIRSQEVNAEYAVATTADNFAQMFASMDDAYMQGRAADVKDVSERVLDILCGVSAGVKEMTEPCIIAADDLAPSETVQLDKSKVLGFATMYGSANSHTAILARTMNIPAVIGLGETLSSQYDGKMAVIDGFTGILYVDPDEETLARMQEKRAKDLEQKELLNQLKGKENVTRSGQKINVYANIGNVSDVAYVLENDAMYFHWGGSPQAYSDMKTLKIEHADAVGSVFWKDKSLNRATEHTAFTSTEKMINYVVNKKIRNTTKQPLLLEYTTDEIDLSSLPDSKIANTISIKYSNYQTVGYEYDNLNKVYKRSANNKPSTDLVTENQYTVKNIIVYDLKYSTIKGDTSGRQNIDNIGSGNGYYITNGYATPIVWEKTSRSSQTVYSYPNGKEINVNDGNTFIQVYPTSGTLTINE